MPTKASHPTKIVTCCYCSARSTLPVGQRQLLVCHGCGAPIEKIESLQPDAEKRRKPAPGPKPAIPHPAEPRGKHKAKDRPQRRKKGKYRKRGAWYRFRKALGDWDDLFDFDLDLDLDLDDLLD